MKIKPMIRIGTRESALALYQARLVQQQLKAISVESEIIEITSDGDIDLKTPLYEMGIQGIFTKSLDIALLQSKIDVAVHSAKDIPTRLARGLVMPAILKRGSSHDAIVFPSGTHLTNLSQIKKIATSSLRRRCQWLHRFPDTQLENLRGNVQTRLAKLDASDWDGAVFAHAALERLEITSHQYEILNWMLPAPAQGAIGVVCRENDHAVLDVVSRLNDALTSLCVNMEREFMSTLQGGCAVPIAALAIHTPAGINFKGNLFTMDAKKFASVDLNFTTYEFYQAGKTAANLILEQGGLEIVQSYRTGFQL